MEHLKKGGVVIYPTETAYALGSDATNNKAVALIFKIKQRPKEKTLPLIAGSLALVKKWAVLNKQEKVLAKKYWPGALTLVLKSKKDSTLARGVVAKDKTIAIRVSGGKIARALSQKLGAPVVSTSANFSGTKEIYSVEDIKKIFKKDSSKLIYVLDGGVLKKRTPSTIAKVKDGQIEILRQGEIKII